MPFEPKSASIDQLAQFLEPDFEPATRWQPLRPARRRRRYGL